MKKYIILIAGVLISTHLYADSYVFGGKAQFMGVLVSQGCSISVESPLLQASKTSHIPIEIHLSLCPHNIYDHLVIGISKQNKLTKEIFFTNPLAKNDFDKEISIQGFEYISLGQKLINRVDLPTQDQNATENKIRIFLNKSLNPTNIKSSHILVSIFYP